MLRQMTSILACWQFDCGEKESVCYVDGDTSEWTDKDMVIQYEDGSFISVKYDASDVYLYLHKKGFDLENEHAVCSG